MDWQWQWQRRPSFLYIYAFVHRTQHKTFIHFKIVYNFISFANSLQLLFSLVSFPTHRMLADLWFLFLQNSHFYLTICVLSTLAFVAFRLIFVAVVVGCVVFVASSSCCYFIWVRLYIMKLYWQGSWTQSSRKLFSTSLTFGFTLKMK